MLLSPSGTAGSVLRRIRLDRRRRRRRQSCRQRKPCGRRQVRACSVSAHPVTLTYDNGEGLEFRRTIAVDDKYLFTIKDEVTNKSANPVTLFPYALISRHGTPQTLGYYILHEGLIGVLGDPGSAGIHLQEDRRKEDRQLRRHQRLARHHRQILGRHAAAGHRRAPEGALLDRHARHTSRPTRPTICSTRRRSRRARPASANARLFAGAKEVQVVNDYDKQLKLNRFDLLIDWGWFYFITKPMFIVDRLLLPAGRQFRPRDPDRHRADQDRPSSRSPTSPTPRWRR